MLDLTCAKHDQHKEHTGRDPDLGVSTTSQCRWNDWHREVYILEDKAWCAQGKFEGQILEDKEIDI